MNFLELIFPLIAVIVVNKSIDKKKRHTFDELHSKWINILKTSQVNENLLEKITHGIYMDEDKRTANIENKGSWLLVGIGVSISLVSIILGVKANSEIILLIQLIAIFFFFIAILNLIFAAIGAYKAMKIGMKYVTDVNDLSKTLDKNNDKILDWAARYLANVECNVNLIIKKSNWIDVSQQHFVRGLIFIVVGFVLLSWDLLSSLASGNVNFQGLEIFGNFTNP